jgi:hypothetical protein
MAGPSTCRGYFEKQRNIYRSKRRSHERLRLPPTRPRQVADRRVGARPIRAPRDAPAYAQRFAARQTSSRCHVCVTPRGRAQDTSADVGSFEAEAARNARLHALCSRLMRFMRAGALEQEAAIERERARRYLEAADEKAVEKSARRDARRKTARLVFLRMSLNSALNRRACDVRVFPCLLNCQFKKIRGH